MSRQIEVFLTNQLRNRPLCANITLAKANALMVGKMQSLFPSTRALICFATKCPHGQAVKTSPSHGGIWGSIPHGGTKNLHNLVQVFTYYFLVLTCSPPCLIAHFVCATSLPEPQNTGLTLHYVSKLTRFAISRFPMGVPKKQVLRGLFFLSVVYNGM